MSPGQLLAAEDTQSDYRDATGLLSQVMSWAQTYNARAAGCLLYGPAGIGKTRLATELAATLRQRDGWHTEFVNGPDTLAGSAAMQAGLTGLAALQQRYEHAGARGLLVVVDHPMRQPKALEALGDWLVSRPIADARPVRLLVLAHRPSGWWEEQRYGLPGMAQLFAVTGSGPRVTLGHVGFPDAIDRDQLAAHSLQALRSGAVRRGLDSPGGDGEAPSGPALTSGRPLAIRMAALLALYGTAPTAGDGGLSGLLDPVLDLERRHWQAVLGPLDTAAWAALERGIAQVTLVQGCGSRDAAEALLTANPGHGTTAAAREDVVAVLSRLRALLGEGDALRPLEPHLLGMHLVARVADPPMLEACIAWLWATEGLRGEHTESLVRMVQGATRPEHGAQAAARARLLARYLVQRHAARLAGPIVRAVIETPGALATCLNDLHETLPGEAREALASALPTPPPKLRVLASGPPGSRLLHWLTAESLAAEADMAQPDGLVRPGEAPNPLIGPQHGPEHRLASEQEKVARLRLLAAAQPAAFQRDLASRLYHLNAALVDMWRPEEGLVALREAVALRRQMADRRDEPTRRDLADALDTLGAALDHLGLQGEALATTQDAVMLHRELALARPDSYAAGLTAGLRRLSALGRHDDARATAQELAAVLRGCASQHSGLSLVGLAESLSRLSQLLADLGCHDDALAALQDMVAARRMWASQDPLDGVPALASGLTALASALCERDRLDDALAAMREAVTTATLREGTWPLPVWPDFLVGGDHWFSLAQGLLTLSAALAAAGRPRVAAELSDVGLSSLRPLLERPWRPSGTDALCWQLIQAYLLHCEAAGLSPDAAHLALVADQIDPLVKRF